RRDGHRGEPGRPDGHHRGRGEHRIRPAAAGHRRVATSADHTRCRPGRRAVSADRRRLRAAPRRPPPRAGGGGPGAGRGATGAAGWIGLETTAAAREAGCEVTVVEPEPTALYRALGSELGEMF